MILFFRGLSAYAQIRLRVLGAIILLAAALAVPAVAETSMLPIKLDEYGRITVPVTLEGREQEQYFLLDTAARRSLLLNRDSDTPGVKLYQKGTIRHYSSQGLLRLPAATISSWLVGDRVVKNSIIGLYSDVAGAAGMVGNNVFLGRILHWKPTTDHLNVYTNTMPISGAGWHNVGGKPNRYFSMLLTTEYHGMEIAVLVATGASRTLLSSDAARKLFPASQAWSENNVDYKSIERGLGSERKNFRALTLHDFKIGKWDVGDIEVLSASFDTREITGFMNAPVLILGSDILLQHEVAFDFRDYQLWFKAQ